MRWCTTLSNLSLVAALAVGCAGDPTGSAEIKSVDPAFLLASDGDLVATPIATFQVPTGFQGRLTRLERRPDGGLLSGRPFYQGGQVALELLAIELDGSVSVLGTVPTVRNQSLHSADFDFGPDGALLGSLTNDFTMFRREADGGITHELSNVIFPGSGVGEFRNPLGLGFLPNGRIVVSSFNTTSFGDGAATFGDWQVFAGPTGVFAADIVAIDEDNVWVWTGHLLGDRRILKLARGGGVQEVASLPESSVGGQFGDMIPTIPGAKVGQPGNLLVAAAQSLWEIDPGTGTVAELLGGFVAANGVAYGGDDELYLLDGGDAGDVTVFRIQPRVLEVAVDIKPGSDPNCVNKDSKGRTPAAILASEDFDPSQVDPVSVQLEGVSALRWSLDKDVNDDSLADLVLHFSTEELNATGELTDGNTLELTGALKEDFGGTPIAGGDVVYLAGGPYCLD